MRLNVKSAFGRAGWTAMAAFVCLLVLSVAAPSRALAADGLTVSQKISKTGVTDSVDDWTFAYELTAVTEDAPLPTTAKDGVYSFELEDDGSSLTLPIVFAETDDDALAFTHAGSFEYELACTTEGTDSLTVDSSTYEVFITIHNGESGDLVLKDVVVRNKDTEKKPKSLTFSHAYAGPVATITIGDPPVSKSISGGEPATDSVFRFEFKADDPSYNMPPDSSNGRKVVQVVGSGETEIGNIVFDKPGTYGYQVREIDDHLAGYDYDNSVWRVEYEVTKEGTGLKCERHMYHKGKEVKSMKFAFNNGYSGPKATPLQSAAKVVSRFVGGIVSPKTGDSTWALVQLSSVLVLGGATAVVVGVIGKRRKRKERAGK